MKQYTTPEQTTKLIELGLEKPKNEVKAEQAGDFAWYNPAYSIGELLSFLPAFVNWTPRVIRGNTIEYSFETEGVGVVLLQCTQRVDR